MKIAFGCDHAGYPVREKLLPLLKAAGLELVDFGCTSPQSCDYPDIAAAVAGAVVKGQTERGILLCGTGVGMSIAANKFPGIRAAVCWAPEIAPLVAEHNDANILCLPARFSTPEEMVEWIGIWLKTPASREGRHANRIRKIAALENTVKEGR